MKMSKGIVKYRIPILIISLLLLIPAVLGYVKTRVNYDMLTYLPEEMDTVVGQNVLYEEFGKGAFSFIIVEDMSKEQVSELRQKIAKVDHVASALWLDTLLDNSFPLEMLPDKLYNEIMTENATMIAVFFDSTTSAEETMTAVKEVRKLCDERCYISGMSALVVDLQELCEQEEPIYVGLAVLFAVIAMFLLLDSWLIPFVFLASIGIAILYNMGTNIFLGEISYITKALSAVLQLAVTMDYSIFLWHSYNEEKGVYDDKNDAMAAAISKTFTSVLGSSITTVAGFVALCFMSFSLGMDLGIVMAKGVLLGVIGCVTILPSMILVLDKPLQKTRHKSIIPNTEKAAKGLTKIFPVFIVIFALLVPPAYYGYRQTNAEVYYDFSESLPQDVATVIANDKLREEFNIASTHLVMVNSSVPASDVRAMINEMNKVAGVKYTLGLEALVGPLVPEEALPSSIVQVLKSENWEMLLINSEYTISTDDLNKQIEELNAILKKYDPNGMLIGEGPCMKDMIDITNHDFQVVTVVSVLAIFLIIAVVEKSITLPFILIAVIELGIFINLGLPHYMGQSISFITPICISTIQLGATVDYAILMTTRYKAERVGGKLKREAVNNALATSIPSILVSGFGLFAATFGVAMYSNIDIISSMCMLMARGAIISMLCVVFILPAFLMLADPLIVATTFGMKNAPKNK